MNVVCPYTYESHLADIMHVEVVFADLVRLSYHVSCSHKCVYACVYTFPADDGSYSAQQYQKRFKLWNLTKNISSKDWLDLSQQLKRYCISLDDIDPRSGSLDIMFNGHVLGFSKVQKGIYRYDTSLLRSDTWSGSADLTSMEEFEKLSQRVGARFVMKDKTDLLSTKLPKELIFSFLGTPSIREASKQLTNHRMWSLRKRSDKRTIHLPADREQIVFISCMESIVSDEIRETCLSYPCTVEELCQHWQRFLDSIASEGQTWRAVLPTLRQNIHRMGSHVATNILMVVLICCVLTTPKMVSGVLSQVELAKLLAVRTRAPRSLCNLLLEVVFFAMIHLGETATCAQLIAGGISPNVSGPYLRDDRGALTTLTALQASLGAPQSCNGTLESEIFAMLLENGADPNCTNHRQVKSGCPLHCISSPFYLALKHPPAVLQALLDSGVRIPESIQLMDCGNIPDIGMLLLLMRRGVLLQGVAPDSVSKLPCVCLLQAVLRCKHKALAWKLLDTAEGPLGCSIEELEQKVVEFCRTNPKFGSPSRTCTSRITEALDFRTPLAYAVLGGFSDIADELLRRGAHPDKSYIDYLSSRVIFERSDNCLSSLDAHLGFNSVGPLQAAIWKRKLTAVQSILAKGADPNHLQATGLSALATAMWYPNKSIINLLLEQRAFIFLEDLYRIVEVARSEEAQFKGKLSCVFKRTTDYMEGLWKKRIYALEELTHEIELRQCEGRTDNIIEGRCHATVTQFHKLLQAFQTWQ